jgi:hypothetical protein
MLAVDGPKTVIAVFQRDEYELPSGDMAVSSGPESLTRRTDSISSGGFSGGGGACTGAADFHNYGDRGLYKFQEEIINKSTPPASRARSPESLM